MTEIRYSPTGGLSAAMTYMGHAMKPLASALILAGHPDCRRACADKTASVVRFLEMALNNAKHANDVAQREAEGAPEEDDDSHT